MKAQTFQYLTEWTTMFHNNLADAMEKGRPQQTDERAKWVLEYLIDHERTMAKEVEGFKEQANPNALKTWLYEQITETLPPDAKTRDIDFGTMDFDAISKEIFDVHNQVIEVWESMIEKAAVPEASALAQKVYDMEKNETMRLADQITSVQQM